MATLSEEQQALAEALPGIPFRLLDNLKIAPRIRSIKSSNHLRSSVFIGGPST